MKTTIKTLVAAAAIVCVSSFAQAQTSTSLQDLLQKVKQKGTAQSQINKHQNSYFNKRKQSSK